MLKINRQTDYAVRVVLALSQRNPGARISSAVIQKEMRIPRAFMSRIVAELAANKLILTFPGRDGGLSLPKPAKEITLRHVVEAFEGPFHLSECMHSTIEDDDCPFVGSCPVRSKWGRVQLAMLREMGLINFADLAAEGNPALF